MTRLLIADPTLRRQLQGAARQFGVKTIEELATALADAGFLTVDRPLDALTLPREAVGAALYEQLQEPIPDSFADLLPAQKQAVILYCCHRGDSPHQIASRFWLPVEEVMRTWSRYADLVGQDILQVRFESFVGQLAMRADDLYARALQSDNLKVAADVLFRYTKAMQDLGVLYRAPTTVVTMDVTQAKEIELEAMRIVELKKKMIDEPSEPGTTAETQD